jgi:hypothetical protein
MKPPKHPPVWSTAKHGIALRCVTLYCVCSLLFSPALYSQEPQPAFGSIDSDLLQLENLITDTLLSMEAQQQQLDGLRRNLSESETLIAGYETITTAQEQSLQDLQMRLAAMSKIYLGHGVWGYRTLIDSAPRFTIPKLLSNPHSGLQLSARYAKSSKFWKVCTLIAVPTAAAAGLLTGWAMSR